MSREARMQCYAVGILRQVRLGPPVVEYVQRIDETLVPFGGHFIVHGGMTEVLEGTPAGLPGRGGRTRGVGCAP